MNEIFSGCSSLIELDLSNFKIHDNIPINYLFSGCSSLKELNISNFTGLNISNSKRMFYGCSSLINLNIPFIYINDKNKFEKIFEGCTEELKQKIIKNIIFLKEPNYDYMKSLGSSKSKKIILKKFSCLISLKLEYLKEKI